ncbi:hypothetical protein ACWV27_26045 (plasmid) [Massilia varians]|jgi:hypothetical protein|uniref:hypothetical protein n=1 Tax=Massilia TaxID=149698 RepID=UPI0004220E21|nr:hypothetical protein [Massilia alkalitolerans]
MTDMTQPLADAQGSQLSATMSGHPDTRGKYAASVSYHDGMVALTLRYVERPWLPLGLFGRVIQTRLVHLGGEGVREMSMVNDAQGLVCTVARPGGVERITLLGVEWPGALREAVRSELDASLHRKPRGLSLQFNRRTTVVATLLIGYAAIVNISGPNSAPATAPVGVSSPAGAAEPLTTAPVLSTIEADGMSSAAVAQAAVDRQASPMSVKEALSKASSIELRAPGAGGKGLIIWSDPLCPNCRDFDQKVLAKLPATVGLAVIPVSFKNGSRPLVSYASCASTAQERAARWANLMAETPKDLDLSQQCEAGPATADGNTVLFARVGLTQTPTLMKPDGQIFDGDLRSAEAIASWLAK